MSEDIRTINIKCPLCKESHPYNISVDESHVIYNITMNSFSNKRNIKKFKRIFLCPTKDKMFESILSFEESFGIVINDVKVLED